VNDIKVKLLLDVIKYETSILHLPGRLRDIECGSCEAFTVGIILDSNNTRSKASVDQIRNWTAMARYSEL